MVKDNVTEQYLFIPDFWKSIGKVEARPILDVRSLSAIEEYEAYLELREKTHLARNYENMVILYAVAKECFIELPVLKTNFFQYIYYK